MPGGNYRLADGIYHQFLCGIAGRHPGRLISQGGWASRSKRFDGSNLEVVGERALVEVKPAGLTAASSTP